MQPAVLRHLPKTQIERPLHLNDFMPTNTKLNYINMEDEIWDYACTDGLTQPQYDSWFKEKMISIGIKKDVVILIGDALKKYLQDRFDMERNNRPVRIICNSVWDEDKDIEVIESIIGKSG